jgi:hypothetical protein
MLPGTTVTLRDSAPPRISADDTSVWFVAGITEQGPLAPTLIESLEEYEAVFGARVSYGILYDSLDAFFNEGGNRAYVTRVVGPTPVLASHTFLDAVPVSSLIINAKSYGDWGNGLSVAITQPDGTHFVLAVSLNGTLVETSESFTTQQQAVDWSAGSDYVDITLGVGTAIPEAATSALSGGTDDHGNAVDANWKTALDLFTKDLGPGQVSMPGRSTAQSHADTLAHALGRNRVAIVDFADTASKATLVAAAAADRALSGARTATGFAPWATIPGVVSGTTRAVPYSAIEAGIMARNDAAGLSQNVAAAGTTNGVAHYAVGLSQVPWSEGAGGDREALNDAGVNVALIKDGAVTTYGYRTLVDPATDPNHLLLTNARLEMEIVAKANEIGERYVFDEIDGRGFAIKEFGGDLAAMLDDYWRDNSLYGPTAAEAYAVNVGPPVNTDATAAANELNAQLSVRYSPYAERTEIFLTRKPITEAVA